MDVTCNRCGTDYEFEETLVSTRGTTVKCTSCGHLFKVFRGVNQEHTPTDDSRPWLVRRRNGDVEPLVSLGDLTRMIASAEITPEDEISRTGQAWKKLGEIAELQSFFANPKRAQAAMSATPALGLESPSLRPPRNSEAPAQLPIGVGSVPPEHKAGSLGNASGTLSTRSSTPPTPPAPPKAELPKPELPKPTLSVDEPPAAQEHTPRERPSARSRNKARQGSSDSSRSMPAVSTSGQSGGASPSLRPPAPPPRHATAPASPTSPTPPPPPSDKDKLEAGNPMAAPSGFPWGRTLLLIALVGLGMGAYAWGRKLVLEPAKVSPAATFVMRGDEAMAAHDLRHFADAVTEYTKALAFNENDAAVLTRLSRAHAVWADALENVAQWDVLRATDARAERKRHVTSARAQAEAALRVSPGDVEGEIVMADALRLDGAINAARARLSRVMEPSERANAETLRVASLLAAAESDGDLTQALQLAVRAVDRDPALIRAHLLLAKLLLSSGDTPSAREHVRTILKQHPTHKLAGMLLSVIESKAVAPSAPTTTKAADAGVDAATAAAAATTPTTSATSSTSATAASSATASGTSTSATPSHSTKSDLPASYEELIRRGETLLERGAIKTAKEAFERALALRPGAAPALTGLGYVALERGDAAGAVRLFTPASNAGNGDAFIGLGDAYRQLGRHAEALRAYESYLNRFPSGPRSSIARRQAERLREQVNRSTASGRPAANDVGGAP